MKADFPSTLFPLRTNLLMAELHGNELKQFIANYILNRGSADDCFLPQQRVFATKPRGHLRRTVKLDPISEFYIYDICWRNRQVFRPEVSESRRSFGYRFSGGEPVPVHIAYQDYKAELGRNTQQYSHNIKFDVASYFNSIYHHDLCQWFQSQTKVSIEDGRDIGQFFRETNSGRSIDFLPQGIYPSKMLGNAFLKYIDLTGSLRSQKIVRFMDDFVLFDDDLETLKRDFVRIQELLGQHALNVNPSKTYYDALADDVATEISDTKQELSEILEDYEEGEYPSGFDPEDLDDEDLPPLSDGQIASLLKLLRSDTLDESDADTILRFIRTHSGEVLELLPSLFKKFPNLVKHLHSICIDIQDVEGVAGVVLDVVNADSNLLEYQLFWLATIVEDHLMSCRVRGDILTRIYERTAEMPIARSKVLEIPEQGFGFKEIRDVYLKSGQSDWLSWSSAVGARSLERVQRNHLLGYFSNCSSMNKLIANMVRSI